MKYSHDQIIDIVTTACGGCKWKSDYHIHNHKDIQYTKVEWMEKYKSDLENWDDKTIQDHNFCFPEMPYDDIVDALRIEITAIKIIGDEPPPGSMKLIYNRFVQSKFPTEDIDINLKLEEL